MEFEKKDGRKMLGYDGRSGDLSFFGEVLWSWMGFYFFRPLPFQRKIPRKSARYVRWQAGKWDTLAGDPWL